MTTNEYSSSPECVLIFQHRRVGRKSTRNTDSSAASLLITGLHSRPTGRSPENSAYLFAVKKNKKKQQQQKEPPCHVFSCPATPTAFSVSRGFCAPEACTSACACCSARKGLAVMAPWPWLWAPGSRLLIGS